MEEMLKELREMMLVQAEKAEKSKEEMFEKIQEQAENTKKQNADLREMKLELQEQAEKSKEEMFEKFQEQAEKSKIIQERSKEQICEKINAFQMQLQAVEEACKGSRKELETRINEIEDSVTQSLQSVTIRQELTETKIQEIEERVELVQKNGKQLAGAQLTQLADRVQVLENSQGCVNSTIAKTSTIKPAPYDGTISWQEYEVQFTAIAEFNGWSDRDCAGQLAAMLRGSALVAFQNMNPDERRSYTALKAMLSQRYGEESLAPLYWAQLVNKRQAPGERLADLATDIERLVNRAAGKAPRETLGNWEVQYFANAVRERRIKEAILLAKPKNINEALAAALQMETVSHIPEVSRIRSATTSPSHTTPAMDEVFRRLADLEERNRHRYNPGISRVRRWTYNRGRNPPVNGTSSERRPSTSPANADRQSGNESQAV